MDLRDIHAYTYTYAQIFQVFPVVSMTDPIRLTKDSKSGGNVFFFFFYLQENINTVYFNDSLIYIRLGQ